MVSARTSFARTFLEPLRHGCDLLEEIGRVCGEQNIIHAAISVIGAVSSASFGFYDQQNKKYLSIRKPGSFELITCTGNITLKEGKPFPHAHALFGQADGTSFGGHLLSPTVVFAAELHVMELAGQPPERVFDERTGLYLWKAL